MRNKYEAGLRIISTGIALKYQGRLLESPPQVGYCNVRVLTTLVATICCSSNVLKKFSPCSVNAVAFLWPKLSTLLTLKSGHFSIQRCVKRRLLYVRSRDNFRLEDCGRVKDEDIGDHELKMWLLGLCPHGHLQRFNINN